MTLMTLERLGLLVALVGGCRMPNPDYLGSCLAQSDDGTALFEEADALEPGQWGSVVTQGFTPELIEWSSDWIGLASNDAVWDPTRRRLHFSGLRSIEYDAVTNAWQMVPGPRGPTCECTEGGDNNATDAGAVGDARPSMLFHREFGTRVVHRRPSAGGAWETMPEIPTDFSPCCPGFEYFPPRDELLYADPGGLFVFDMQSQAWSNPFGTAALDVVDRNFIVYSPVHEVALIVGGETRTITIYDGAGELLPREPPPTDLVNAVITADLATGDFLVFTDTSQLWVYDPIDDVWEERSADVPPFTRARSEGAKDFIAAPLPSYCATMFMVYNFSDSSIWLRRSGA